MAPEIRAPWQRAFVFAMLARRGTLEGSWPRGAPESWTMGRMQADMPLKAICESSSAD